MKTKTLLLLAFCGAAQLTITTQAQSLKDLLNSTVVKDVVSSVVTGEKTVTSANLLGTWNYVNPTVKLESENALKSVAAKMAAGEMEKKLAEICAKAGIKANMFNYTFNADSTFCSEIKGKTLNGTYSINKATNTIELHYGRFENLRLTTLKAQPLITDNQLSLLFEADKLLDFLGKVATLSDNSTLKMVSQLAQQYDGMLMGFELKK